MKKRILIYLFGIVLTGLSVNLILLSRLGAGGWDAVSYNLSVLTNISVGTASALINATIMLVITLYHRRFKYFLVIIPILGIALSIDIWYLFLFQSLLVDIIYIQIIIFVVGALLLPLALVMIVLSNFPAMIFEEFTFVLMKLLHIKKFVFARLIIESFAFLLAILFGILANIGLGALSIGSFIISLSIGPIMNLYLKWFKHKKETN